MALVYLQIFADKEELLEPFDDAERGRLLTAMLSYALHDEEMVLTGNERYIWPVFKQMIDASKAANEAKSKAGKARHENNDQQTAAESSTSQQDSAEVSSSHQEPAKRPIIQESRIKNQDIRIKNKEGIGEKRERFSPPSPAEVDAYAKEQGINVNGQRFCDFYAAKGWKVGNTGMKDWKAAARNWASRDNIPRGSPQIKAVEQQQYTQREYKHTDDAMDRMMAEFHGGAG